MHLRASAHPGNQERCVHCVRQRNRVAPLRRAVTKVNNLGGKPDGENCLRDGAGLQPEAERYNVLYSWQSSYNL